MAASHYIFTIVLSIVASSGFAVDPQQTPNTEINQYLYRDGYGRPDPNGLLNGFFPAWAIILLCLSGIFMITGLMGFIGYKLGCVNPKKLEKLQVKN